MTDMALGWRRKPPEPKSTPPPPPGIEESTRRFNEVMGKVDEQVDRFNDALTEVISLAREAGVIEAGLELRRDL